MMQSPEVIEADRCGSWQSKPLAEDEAAIAVPVIAEIELYTEPEEPADASYCR